VGVDPGEPDPLELHDVVGIVLGDARLGVPFLVALGAPQAEPPVVVGGHPVDHVDVALPNHLDALARILQGVPGVAHAAVAFQPDPLAVRRDVLWFDQDGATYLEGTRPAFLVVGVDRWLARFWTHQNRLLDRIPDEKQPVGAVVDQLAVPGVDRGHRELDVRGGGAEFDHGVDDRFPADPPAPEARQGGRSGVIPAV